MRAVKSLKVVFRTAIGGGLMLVLSGGAFAAESGAGTTSQSADSSISQGAQSSSIDGNTAGSVSVAITNNTNQNGTSGAGLAATGADNQIAGQTQVPSAPGVTSLTAADISPQASLQASAAGNAGDPAFNSVDQGAVTAPAVISDTPTKTDGLTQVAELAQMVVFRSARLVIQPTITSTNFRANDLASMVPSAPAQQQNPSDPPIPSAPNGLFGDFSAKLALIVVPSVFSFSDLSLLGLGIAISILLAVLYIAGGYAVMAIGSWTRRGGYAHAARSDVPAAGTFTTFFATPLRLGYVSALAPPHSSFLMVSDNKKSTINGPQCF